MGDGLYATEVAFPNGAAVSTADKQASEFFHATKVASPRNDAMFGASTSVDDRHTATVLYANEFASPGASTLVVDKKLIDYFYATEVASPERE